MDSGLAVGVATEVARAGRWRASAFVSVMRERMPAVYLMASKRHGTLYVGVTSDLVQRVWQHRTDAAEGFTRKHRVHQLVWYEQATTMESAIIREKQLKKWERAWKIEMIERENPAWRDLWPEISGDSSG